MPLVVDYTQAKTFEAFEKGDYPATYTSHEVKEATNSNYPNLIGTFTFNEDAGPGIAGKTISRYWTSNPDGLDFFRRDMTALGSDPDDFRGPKAQKLDMEKVSHDNWGNQCILRVDKSEYEGEMRNNVKKVMPKRG
jgi:hypothetical protein